MKLTDEQAIEYMYRNGHFSLPVADYITKRLKENEQLQAQVARMWEALEEATETIENIYEKDTPQTEKYRDMLNSSTQIEYHNPADVAALKQAREAFRFFKEDMENPTVTIDEAIAAIDKMGGKEDV